jgi:hypothetical protein
MNAIACTLGSKLFPAQSVDRGLSRRKLASLAPPEQNEQTEQSGECEH